MSILIKGKTMPKSCWVCNFCRHFDEPNQGFFCLLLEEKVEYESSSLYRKKNCPLIEILPHGRLIDADVLKARVQKLQEWLWDKLTDANVGIVTANDVRYRIAEESEEFIDDAPTIIRAEDGE